MNIKVLLATSLILVLSNTAIAQDCQTSLATSNPATRFTDNGDGTISDKDAGLMWKKCYEGLSGNDCLTGQLNIYTWKTAFAQVKGVNNSVGFANHHDWRLPNVKELNSLVEHQCAFPAVNLNLFPSANPNQSAWSSSPNSTGSAIAAWYVYFGTGAINIALKTSEMPVRLVRDIQ